MAIKKAIYTILFLFIVVIGNGQLVFSLDDDAAYVAKMEKEAAATTTDSAKAYAFLKLSALCRLINDTGKINNYLQRGLAMSKPNSFTEAAYWFYKAQTLYPTGNIPAIESCLLKGDSMLRRFQYKEAYKIR